MPISRNLLSGRILYRHPTRAKRLRSAKEPLSMVLALRGVRYGLHLSLAFRILLTTGPNRRRSRSHPQPPPSLRINVSRATTTVPSGRLSNAKNAASRPTRERSASSLNRWTLIIGYARSARTTRCRRRRWIRLVCFVPRSGMILRMVFTPLRIRSCVPRSLRRVRDGYT